MHLAEIKTAHRKSLKTGMRRRAVNRRKQSDDCVEPEVDVYHFPANVGFSICLKNRWEAGIDMSKFVFFSSSCFRASPSYPKLTFAHAMRDPSCPTSRARALQ